MQFMPALSIGSIGIYSVITCCSLYHLILSLLNYIHLIQYLHYSMDILRVFLLPALCALVPCIIICLLGLLFAFFMPPLLIVLICFPLYSLAFFFAICRTGLINIYSLKRVPLGRYISRLGRKLHFLGDEQ